MPYNKILKLMDLFNWFVVPKYSKNPHFENIRHLSAESCIRYISIPIWIEIKIRTFSKLRVLLISRSCNIPLKWRIQYVKTSCHQLQKQNAMVLYQLVHFIWFLEASAIHCVFYFICICQWPKSKGTRHYFIVGFVYKHILSTSEYKYPLSSLPPSPPPPVVLCFCIHKYHTCIYVNDLCQKVQGYCYFIIESVYKQLASYPPLNTSVPPPPCYALVCPRFFLAGG